MFEPSLHIHPSVMIVIPNWNLKNDLAECLDSLLANHYPDLHIVVIDNASSDGSAEFISSQYPLVRVIRLDQNRGYAGALNIGIEMAQEIRIDFILALNNDTVIPPGAIDRLVQRMLEDPTVGVVAPKVLYAANPQIIFSLGDRRYPFIPLPVGYGYKKKDGPRYAGVMEFDYVTGCAMLIRRSVIDQIGSFDTSMFMYYEDADFCRRARDAGWRIVCDGGTTILHKAQLSSKNDRAGTLKTRTHNRVWFYRRYPHGPFRWVTYAMLWVIAFWKLLAYHINGKSELASSYWQGFLQGWKSPLPPVTFAWQSETKR